MATSSNAFTFGHNWRKFLRHYTPQRQRLAQDALLGFLKLDNLHGKNFLDIGCGSGIHSAAAWLAGAARVHSFDYDAESVEATRELHRRYGAPTNWTIAQGTVLEPNYMRRLGTFDIVYSWGVLHHTGNQWQALHNALLPLEPHGRLYIALYAKEAYPDWRNWQSIKQRYNHAGFLEKRRMELAYLWQTHLSQDWKQLPYLPKFMREYQQTRGMDLMTDIRDWLGGWPTEFSSVKEVVDFMAPHQLALANLAVGEGNTEFLFARRDQLSAIDLEPVDLSLYQDDVSLLEDGVQLTEPVWIFGTGRGGDLLFDYFSHGTIKVTGFIDIEKRNETFHGMPVLQIEDFEPSKAKAVPVILSNRFVRENAARLRHAGFGNIFNAHPLVMRLNRSAKRLR